MRRKLHEVENQLMADGAFFRGTFEVVCKDKDGRKKWAEHFNNVVVDNGLDHILDVVFHNTTQITEWFVGLKGSGAISSGDTLATHAGWTEVTAYSGTDRKEYNEGAASGQSISNSSNKATFGITSTATVAGAFLASSATAGYTTGTLICVADFGSAKGVSTNDTLEVTYTLSAADDGA